MSGLLAGLLAQGAPMPPLPILVGMVGGCALAPAFGMIAILTRRRRPRALYWVAAASYYISFAASYGMSDFDAGPGTLGFAAGGLFLFSLPIGLLLCLIFIISAFRPAPRVRGFDVTFDCANAVDGNSRRSP